MKSGVTSWPNGKKIAVAVTVMLETWAEGKSSSLLTPKVQLKEGVIDNQSNTWGQYGGTAGVWRLIQVLDQCGVPATFCTNARCAEIFPEAIAQIVRSGHDIAAHAYTQDQLLPHFTPEQEHELIRRCIDVLETRSGKRPEGWLSPRLAWTEHTDEFLAQEKLLWRGDANYIDLPRRVGTKHGMIAHIPHSDYTDNRVLPLSPRQYFDTYKDTFDYLYLHESMALLVLTVHCHFGGRPLMSAVFNRLLRYFSEHPDVWFARHNELARWALEGECDEITNAQRFFPS
jgi:allantoinase